jgi:hypothetical protein
MKERAKQQRESDPIGERGSHAAVDRATGEVHGSGAGAGGNNPGEDYDGDSIAGGGVDPVGGPKDIDDAVQRPLDRHQGRHG